MKDPRLIIATLLILALGALVFADRQSIQELQRQIAQLKQEAEARAAASQGEVEQLRRKVEDGKQVISQLESRTKELAASDAPGKAAEAGTDGDADAKKGGEGFGKMVQKMFTDPKMKGVMRTQQMMVVKMMYSDLAKELGLGPDQANQVMELLGDRQMAMASKGMKMFGGDSGEAASAEEVGRDAEASNKEYDAQLENILGKDGMAKLKEYERSAGDRMQIQQYQQAFGANGTPLDQTQSQGLLGIMKEERAKLPPSPFDPASKDVAGAMKAMQSEETVNALINSQQELNARVLTRSRTVLSPDQMVQFEQIQKQQMDLQKMGMEMGRQFMKGK